MPQDNICFHPLCYLSFSLKVLNYGKYFKRTVNFYDFLRYIGGSEDITSMVGGVRSPTRDAKRYAQSVVNCIREVTVNEAFLELWTLGFVRTVAMSSLCRSKRWINGFMGIAPPLIQIVLVFQKCLFLLLELFCELLRWML